jgi:2-polyprenyl-6-methoxyphenol hydroxylase-like FAD-dependent oxidoreductase
VLLAGAGTGTNDGRRKHAGESLPPAARPLLHALGVLDRIRNDGHLACTGSLSVWGSPLVRCVDFIFDPNGSGWILDRPVFDAALVEAARAAGAEVCGDLVKRVRRRKSGRWRLIIEGARSGEHEIGCRWIIDSSGRRAAIARHLGAKLRVRDRLTAFTAMAAPSRRRDTERRTLVEAVPDGWWYTSLVHGGRRVFMYLTDADLAPRGITREARVFRSLLDQTACVGPYFRAFRYKLENSPRASTARTVRLPPGMRRWPSTRCHPEAC